MSSEPIPKPSKGDVVHALTKAALSTIPVAGGPAVELFQLAVQPPIERRRVKWMEEVGVRLHRLETEGLKLEDLQHNEQFVSAVLQATQIAVRTHNIEKIRALQAALENIARGQAPEEAMQAMFFSFIDSMPALQLQMLAVFSAPQVPPGISIGGLSTVLEHNIPELRGKRDLYDQLWKDLWTRGLVNTEGLNTTMSGNGLASRRTSALGESFLSFIREREA